MYFQNTYIQKYFPESYTLKKFNKLAQREYGGRL